MCRWIGASCQQGVQRHTSTRFLCFHMRSTRFNANCWFSTEHDDFQLERDLFPVGECVERGGGALLLAKL